jgi:hypothetical protein
VVVREGVAAPDAGEVTFERPPGSGQGRDNQLPARLVEGRLRPFAHRPASAGERVFEPLLAVEQAVEGLEPGEHRLLLVEPFEHERELVAEGVVGSSTARTVRSHSSRCSAGMCLTRRSSGALPAIQLRRRRVARASLDVGSLLG